jgi:hypothetical protein
MFLVLIFIRGCVNSRATIQPEGNMSLKNPMTPPGIDPGTIQPVAQRLKHYATPGPIIIHNAAANSLDIVKNILQCFG